MSEKPREPIAEWKVRCTHCGGDVLVQIRLSELKRILKKVEREGKKLRDKRLSERL